jgi:hypothetical protein
VFSLVADVDGIAESPYLHERASCVGYEATVTIEPDSWHYDGVTRLRMAELPEPLAHRDRNTLHRVG